MPRVAEELNTGAASLYWHVGSKDGLLDLVFDHVIGEQHVPDPELQSQDGDAPVQDAGNMARDYIACLPPEQFPNVIAVTEHFAFADPDERFELLLDLFVGGLAQRAGS